MSTNNSETMSRYVALLMVLVYTVWSSSMIVGKVLMNVLPPFTLSFVRFAISGSLFAVLMLAKKEVVKSCFTKHWWRLIILGLTGVFGFNSFVYIAFQYTTATKVGMIYASTPLITAFLANWRFKERVTSRHYVGLIICLLGISWIISGNWAVWHSIEEVNVGDVWAMVAAITWAVYSVVGKEVMKDLSPLYTSGLATFLGLPFLLVAMVMEKGLAPLAGLSPEHWLSVLYVGVFASVLGFLGFYIGVKELGAAKAIVFANLQPLFTTIMAMLFLGERLSIIQLIGGGFLVFGVYWASSVSTGQRTNLGSGVQGIHE